MRLNPGKYEFKGEAGPSFDSADGAVFWSSITSTSKADFGARVFRQTGDAAATEIDLGIGYLPYHIWLSLSNGKLYATCLAGDSSRVDRVQVPGFTVPGPQPQPAPVPAGMVLVPLPVLQNIVSTLMGFLR